MSQIIHAVGLEHPLHEFEIGARVWRPCAGRFEFAYMRLGRVFREFDVKTGEVREGVKYVGADAIIQYGPEDVFAYVTLE